MCGYFGPHNYVSMRKRGTSCIAPKICGAHFKGSIILRGALRRLQDSAGQILTANLPCGVLEPSKCAPRNYGAFEVRPAEFWSNATFAPLYYGDINYGGQNIHINHLKLRFSLFFKVIFVNHCHFRYLYNQYNILLRKILFTGRYL